MIENKTHVNTVKAVHFVIFTVLKYVPYKLLIEPRRKSSVHTTEEIATTIAAIASVMLTSMRGGKPCKKLTTIVANSKLNTIKTRPLFCKNC